MGWSVRCSPKLYPYLKSRGVSAGLIDIECQEAEVLAALLRVQGLKRVVALSAIDHKSDSLNTLKRAAIAAGIPLSMTHQECLALAAAVEAVRNSAELAVTSVQELWSRQPSDAAPGDVGQVAGAPAPAMSPTAW